MVIGASKMDFGVSRMTSGIPKMILEASRTSLDVRRMTFDLPRMVLEASKMNFGAFRTGLDASAMALGASRMSLKTSKWLRDTRAKDFAVRPKSFGMRRSAETPLPRAE